MADFAKITHTVPRLVTSLKIHLKLNCLVWVWLNPARLGGVSGRVGRSGGLGLGSYPAQIGECLG